jgi:YHS domain-containing protein
VNERLRFFADAADLAAYEEMTYHFCSVGCRSRFLADPAPVLASAR